VKSAYVYARTVPEKVRSRVLRALERVPENHYRGAKFEWWDSTDPFNRYYGKGPHGRYLKENDTIVLRPLVSLQVRTIVHEVGHRVYNRLLSDLDRVRWKAAALKDKYHTIVPWGPPDWRTEEYFAELYVCKYYPRGALCNISRSDPETRTLFNEFLRQAEG